MKKQFMALMMAAVMVGSLTACGSSTKETTAAEAPAENGGVLVMATNAEFPPYEYHDGGEIVGIDVEIEIVEWSSFTPMRRAGEYEAARNGWVGDYPDASNQLDLFYSSNGNNDGKFNKAAYDAAMDLARTTTDAATRTAALHQAEDILMEETGCIPLAYYNDFWLQSEKISGIWHSDTGYWYFMYADIAE